MSGEPVTCHSTLVTKSVQTVVAEARDAVVEMWKLY